MTCLDLAGLWNQPAPPEAPMMPTHLCSEPLKLTPARVTQGQTLMSRVGLGVLIMLPRASTPSAQPPELFSMTACSWIGSPRSLWYLEQEKQRN